MEHREVLVVGETPSLGRAVADMLESAGLPARFVADLTSPLPRSDAGGPRPVVVVACNEAYCATARRYARGEFPDVTMVVVGSRDPMLTTIPGIHLVRLPLTPAPLLALVRGLSGPQPELA